MNYPKKITISFSFEGIQYHVVLNIHSVASAGSNYNAFYHVYRKGDRQPIGGSSMKEDTPINEVIEKALQLIKPELLKADKNDIVNKWWDEADFKTMERITHYRQLDFCSEDGSQDFVDACNNYWSTLSLEDRISIWEELKND